MVINMLGRKLDAFFEKIHTVFSWKVLKRFFFFFIPPLGRRNIQTESRMRLRCADSQKPLDFALSL